jgi:hypothetical protein
MVHFIIIYSNRMASSLRKQIIQDFQRQLFKTGGIQTVILTAYKQKTMILTLDCEAIHFPLRWDSHSHPMCRDDVESVLNNGISFLKFCPYWKTTPLWEQWT